MTDTERVDNRALVDKFKFTLSPISPALKMPLYHPVELVRLSRTRLDYSDVTR